MRFLVPSIIFVISSLQINDFQYFSALMDKSHFMIYFWPSDLSDSASRRKHRLGVDRQWVYQLPDVSPSLSPCAARPPRAEQTHAGT